MKRKQPTKADLCRQIRACITPMVESFNWSRLETHPVKELKGILKQRRKAYLEEWFLIRISPELANLGIRMPGRNKCYIPNSKLEFDFSWKSLKLAVEVQGGIASASSGHRTYAGVRRDMLKMCLAQANGWLLLQLTPENVKDALVWKRWTLPLIRQAIRVCWIRSQLEVS